MHYLPHILESLRVSNVQEIVFCLNGSGDSGTVTLDYAVLTSDEVLYDQDLERLGILKAPIGINNDGDVIHIDDVLEGEIADLPDIDWVNNDGGSGTVTLNPQEDNDEMKVEVDVTAHEPDDDEGFEDEFEADDGADAPAGPAAF